MGHLPAPESSRMSITMHVGSDGTQWQILWDPEFKIREELLVHKWTEADLSELIDYTLWVLNILEWKNTDVPFTAVESIRSEMLPEVRKVQWDVVRAVSAFGAGSRDETLEENRRLNEWTKSLTGHELQHARKRDYWSLTPVILGGLKTIENPDKKIGLDEYAELKKTWEEIGRFFNEWGTREQTLIDELEQW